MTGLIWFWLSRRNELYHILSAKSESHESQQINVLNLRGANSGNVRGRNCNQKCFRFGPQV